jgi:hypothetical protein
MTRIRPLVKINGRERKNRNMRLKFAAQLSLFSFLRSD